MCRSRRCCRNGSRNPRTAASLRGPSGPRRSFTWSSGFVSSSRHTRCLVCRDGVAVAFAVGSCARSRLEISGAPLVLGVGDVALDVQDQQGNVVASGSQPTCQLMARGMDDQGRLGRLSGANRSWKRASRSSAGVMNVLVARWPPAHEGAIEAVCDRSHRVTRGSTPYWVGAPRCSRRVAPSYSRWNSPRSWRMGTTPSTKASTPSS